MHLLAQNAAPSSLMQLGTVRDSTIGIMALAMATILSFEAGEVELLVSAVQKILEHLRATNERAGRKRCRADGSWASLCDPASEAEDGYGLLTDASRLIRFIWSLLFFRSAAHEERRKAANLN
jgi:hypothetical protein